MQHETNSGKKAMRIAFFIDRINIYRSLASLVHEALRRGHTVECWHNTDPSIKSGDKGYLFADPAKSPFRDASHPNLTIVSFNTRLEMEHAIRTRKEITHIFSLCPPEEMAGEETLRQFEGTWCLIMHGPDSFKETVRFTRTPPNTSVKRLFFPYTQHFFDWGMSFSDRFLPIARAYYSLPNTTVIPAGCTMFDEMLEQLPQDEVRAKYGIPAGRKVLIYLPYAYLPSKNNRPSRAWQTAFWNMHIRRFSNKRFNESDYSAKPLMAILNDNISYMKRVLADSTARRWMFNGWNEPAVIRALRTFCDNNGLFLVVKPRKKFDFSEEVHRMADLIIDDDESQQYPSKLQELLSIAALGVGFYSTAVIEAVNQSVPFVNIGSMDERVTDADKRPWHPEDPGSLYNFDGVVRHFSVPDLIREMPGLHLDSFTMDPAKRIEYMRRFIGPNDNAAKVNIFDALEQERQP